jgi:hypothetical protein
MSGKRFVTEYVDSQCYGGPEEGGWYFWVTEAVQAKKFSSNRSAKRYAEEQNADYVDYNRYNYSDRHRFVIESKRELGKQDNTNEPRPHYE